MAMICTVAGHKLGEPVKVHTNFGFYMARCCARCDKRVPVSDEDAVKKAQSTAYISSVMNGSRAQYGLPPISWGD